MIRTIALASTILIPVMAAAQTPSTSTEAQPGSAPLEQKARFDAFNAFANALNRMSRDSGAVQNMAEDAAQLIQRWPSILQSQESAEKDVMTAKSALEAANKRLADAIKRENEANKLAQSRADDLVKVRAQLQQAQQQIAQSHDEVRRAVEEQRLCDQTSSSGSIPSSTYCGDVKKYNSQPQK